jgi:hypothetical protein
MEPVVTLSDNVGAFAALSDDELVKRVRDLAANERRASVALIRSLVEFDTRRLYLREGCSSLFTYCTQVLLLSEGSAYNRIETARAARRHPNVLEALERGDLTLTAVRLLAPHLTPANHIQVLAAAQHRSKLEIQELIASLAPRPAAATIIRRMASQPPTGDSARNVVGQEADTSLARTAAVTPDDPSLRSTTLSNRSSSGGQDVAATPAPQFRAAVVTPLAPQRYKLQATLARETHDKLRRAQALARHMDPSGDVGSILDRALTLLIDDLERRRFARVASPRPSRSEALRPDVTYPRLSGVPCGSAIKDAAHLSDSQADAARPRSSSSITSRHTRREAPPRRTTSNSSAVRTTSMRRACTSGTARRRAKQAEWSTSLRKWPMTNCSRELTRQPSGWPSKHEAPARDFMFRGATSC